MSKIKAELLDSIGIERALRRISHEIIETNKGVDNVVLLGVARGGIPICQLLAKNIENIEVDYLAVGEGATTKVVSSVLLQKSKKMEDILAIWA